MRRNRIALLQAFFALASAALGEAQPIPESSVPESLRKWIPWVLDGAEERLCPAVSGAAICLWPGRLGLSVDGAGGAFQLDAFADRNLDLPLPGDEKHWPLAVQLDGQPAAVLAKDNRPLVRLAPGAHHLTGRFTWESLPDTLPVPALIGIVDLTVEGRPVPLPRREEGGLLVLRQGGGPTAAGENLRLKVFRQVGDGIPLWVETRLVLEVSGRAREISLQGALLDGTVPVAVSGDLPSRLDPDRKLKVQVRTGTFTVSVLARVAGRTEALRPPKNVPPWPEQEVWVFAAAERLRQVEAGGAPPIDPSRTELPEDWKQLPA